MAILGNTILGRTSGFDPATATGLQGGTRTGTLPEGTELAADGTIMLRLPDGRLVDPNAPFGTGDASTDYGLPALRGSASGESRIDPRLQPYLELGLRVALHP